jgi:glutathione S-transferase
MLKIYHARRARSARIIWLAEELGLPYQLEPVEFKPEALKSPAYVKLHPLGLVPVVEDGDVRLFESGAIIEYLLEKYGQGRLAPPAGARERPEYLQWFHYGEATLARYMSDIVRQRFGEEQTLGSEEILALRRARFHAAVALVDRTLADRAFIFGEEFCAADIMIAYGLVMARIVRELPAEFTHVGAYVERLKQRPSYAPAWS